MGKKKKSDDMTSDDKEDGLQEWEGISDEEKKLLREQWTSTLDNFQRLQGSLNHYCRQVPVLGFNSARYDLNLVKSQLIPWLRADIDPNLKDVEKNFRILTRSCLCFLMHRVKIWKIFSPTFSTS